MKLNLRSVEKKDFEKILEWRNDPDVRISSLTQHIIPIDEHIEYWTEFLKNLRNFAFIVVHDNKDIGVLKLKNINKKTYEIDIFLSKNSRNKGLGQQILMIVKEIAPKFSDAIVDADYLCDDRGNTWVRSFTPKGRK